MATSSESSLRAKHFTTTTKPWAPRLPSPSPEFTWFMQASIDDMDKAMHYCIDGVRTLDPDAIGLSTDYLTKATDHLKDANDAITVL